VIIKVDYKGQEVEFHWPVKDLWFGPIWTDWQRESDTWLSFCKNFDVVVQAGGNLGMYPKLYSLHFNRVYTFEPSMESFTYLVKNCPSADIIKINSAVGDTNKLVGVWSTNEENMGTHFLDKFPYIDDEDFPRPKKTVPTFTIDQLVLDSCDLIHLDCEGSEPEALLGALNTIQEYKPTIVLESGRGEDFLFDLGYTMVFRGFQDGVYTNNS